MSKIELKNVSYRYMSSADNGQENSVDSVTLTINEGEAVAFIGTSGCGKTTLLNILGLLDAPDAGQIYLSGNAYPKINSNKAMLLRRGEINYLFQSFALIDSQSVRSNLLLALQYTKLSKDEKNSQTRQMLKRFGIEDKLDATVNELSGGEKQRIGLARAFLHDAPFLLLDEPTSNLDALNERIILKSLKESGAGKTVVLVSHRKSTLNIADTVINIETTASDCFLKQSKTVVLNGKADYLERTPCVI